MSAITPKVWTIGFIWLVLLGIGFGLLNVYQHTPGPSGEADKGWPVESGIKTTDDHATLIMFLHPYCPCSSASLKELNNITTSCGSAVCAHVVFVLPETSEKDWKDSDLFAAAIESPDLKVVIDKKGDERRIFDAQTSGQVVVYNASGNLVFSGGITASRGHEGDNVGRNAIEEILNGSRPGIAETPVYGCALVAEASLIKGSTWR